MSIIGELAAYDHWRQRVTLVANVLVSPDSSDADIDAAYDEAIERIESIARDGTRPCTHKITCDDIHSRFSLRPATRRLPIAST